MRLKLEHVSIPSLIFLFFFVSRESKPRPGGTGPKRRPLNQTLENKIEASASRTG